MTTPISSQSASGGSVTFSGIPASFEELVLDVDGVSHDAASSAQLRIELSPDGTTFGPPTTFTAGYNAGLGQHGSIVIGGYNNDFGAAVGSINHVANDPGVKERSCNFAWRCSGGIQAIRLSWTAGNFDAGTISLSGR